MIVPGFPVTGFTGGTLDRADAVRGDPAAFAALIDNPHARLLVLDDAVPRLTDAGRLVWADMSLHDAGAELILLGLVSGVPHFVMVAPVLAPPTLRSSPVWAALSVLPRDEAAIFGTAHSLILWHNANRFCARCGDATVLSRAGWGRTCTAHGHEHFPRTDPVVIMLAERDGTDGKCVLVGRQARFPPGNYSALAGFLEPGESVEEAVRREIMEEAGITCGAVRYVGSQPWPFGGAQLMIACIADALDEAITVDTRELEDAMWVTRAEVRAALANDLGRRFNVPPPFAIAHTLFSEWSGPAT